MTFENGATTVFSTTIFDADLTLENPYGQVCNKDRPAPTNWAAFWHPQLDGVLTEGGARGVSFFRRNRRWRLPGHSHASKRIAPPSQQPSPRCSGIRSMH